MSLLLPSFLAGFQQIDLPPERISITSHFVFMKIEHLHLQFVIVYFIVSCQSVDKVLLADEWQQEILLVDGGARRAVSR